jgi:hypothetical protein
MSKSILRKILYKALGFVVFIAIMLLLNVLSVVLPEPHLVSIVLFLNQNIVLLIIMNLLLFFGAVFSALDFPLDLPAPIFNAVGGTLVVTFLIRVFELVAVLTGGIVAISLKPIATLLYILVFMIIFVVGYIVILLRVTSRDERDDEPPHHRVRMRRRR